MNSLFLIFYLQHPKYNKAKGYFRTIRKKQGIAFQAMAY